ncbi:MAG: tRNA pseudouridine(55) synthase TruB [Aaplasma endosymbiont of Hyalomma asiaticum]
MKYGWLNIDKPYNMSSGKVVGIIKKMLKCKVGHAGTLDPLATGVLPIAYGEATKTATYMVDTVKTYKTTFQWGEQRDTDDAAGEVIATSSIKPTEESIREVLSRYIGTIKQIPAVYSAIKIGGKKAYDLARRGKNVALEPRNVCILGIELISVDQEKNTVDLFVTCKKGVYIRSLARDFGAALGCLGYVASLRRTRVGSFTEESAIPLCDFQGYVENSKLDEISFPIDAVMEKIARVEVDEKTAKLLKNGLSIRLDEVSSNGLYIAENYDMCYLSQVGGGPVAVCKVVDGTVSPVRVFNV